jgi:hypothetical protein
MEFQRFDVYRVALEFQVLGPRLVPRRGYASLRDQLDRASASILLSIAEGWTSLSPATGWPPPRTVTRTGCWCASRRC